MENDASERRYFDNQGCRMKRHRSVLASSDLRALVICDFNVGVMSVMEKILPPAVVQLHHVATGTAGDH